MPNKIILFDNKSQCCACGACANICPKQAIKLLPDEQGFMYPVIQKELCIRCGLCKSVCNYSKENTNILQAQQAFGAINTDDSQRNTSASGGIFSMLATNVIETGGIVFGAAYVYEANKLLIRHIEIDNQKDICKIQGSKYVQSEIGVSYTKAREALEQGRKVLFTGTPCQIDGLYGYLKKRYDGLVTVDIICHGVPSAQFFRDYLATIGKKIDGEIVNFCFRNKEKGKVSKARIEYKSRNNLTKTKFIACNLSSYYKLFSDGKIYRENCYTCKYASLHRIGDITIGDFWGVEKKHRDTITKNKIDIQKGISCVLINTEKGNTLFQQCEKKCWCFRTLVGNIVAKNAQLQHPTKRPEQREVIMDAYQKGGYQPVEKLFLKQEGIMRIIKYRISSWIPDAPKEYIKRHMSRNEKNMKTVSR